MQSVTPHLWFDKEAPEASEFYVSVFGGDSAVTSVSTLHHDPPFEDTDIVTFRVRGYEFMAISAGPMFKINPSISFFVNCESTSEVDGLWNQLIDGGLALMPLDEYPFSKRYGWLKDKFGVSWQLILGDPDGDWRPPIVPSLLFVGDVCGKAEEAITFYTSVFADASIGSLHRYGPGQEPDTEGTIMFGDFTLLGQWFAAMDSAHEHDFAFNEAISLLVRCESQQQIDEYWEALSDVPESEQCGWLKDKFGVSWQIAPTAMDEMMQNGTEAQIAALTKAFMPMKKLDIAELQRAYDSAAAD